LTYKFKIISPNFGSQTKKFYNIDTRLQTISLPALATSFSLKASWSCPKSRCLWNRWTYNKMEMM